MKIENGALMIEKEDLDKKFNLIDAERLRSIDIVELWVPYEVYCMCENMWDLHWFCMLAARMKNPKITFYNE